MTLQILITRMNLTIWMMIIFVVPARSEPQNVLKWAVGTVYIKSSILFAKDTLIQFYACLCNRTSLSCTGDRSNGWVTSVHQMNLERSEIESTSTSFSSRYLCERRDDKGYYLYCERLMFSEDGCSSTKSCWSLSVFNQTGMCCELDSVEIIWDPTLEVEEPSYDEAIVQITPCAAGCHNHVTSSSTALLVQTASTSSKLCETGYNPSTVSPSAALAATSSASSPTAGAAQNQDNGDNNAVIIGVVVGIVVLAALLAVIGVVLWRRRRNTTTSTTSSRDNKDFRTSDTSASVALQNVQNVQPSQMSTSFNKPNEISSYTYATVDPEAKTRSKGAVRDNSTKDLGYYSQNYVASDTDPQCDNPNNISNMTENQDRTYYNIQQDQRNSTVARNASAMSLSNGMANKDESEHVYTETDDTNHNTDDAYNTINDNDDDNGTLNSSDVKNFTADPTAASYSYEYVTPGNKTGDSAYAGASLDETGIRNEYSKLHEPTRQLQNPYNVLSVPKENVTENSLSPFPSFSLSGDLDSYSLAQPIDSKDSV